MDFKKSDAVWLFLILLETAHQSPILISTLLWFPRNFVSVNRWEHGNSHPSWEYLRKISKTLNVSIDYLLENDDGDFFSQEETESLLRAAEIIRSKVKKK